VWLLLGMTWYYLRFQDYPSVQKAVIITVIKVADLAMLIYLTNYLLIPYLLYKKKYLSFTFCFLVMIVVSSYSKMQVIGNILDNPAMYALSADNLKARIYDNVLPHIFLVIAGGAIKLIADYTRMQQRLAEIAKEKAETELEFLKSQINPHFLFNSLNSVYFLIDKDNKEARDTLHKFSDMLRYQLYEINGTRIPIEKEIAYLKDYVALQKLRKEDTIDMQLNFAADVNGFSVEPLLFIPFVENAFKHISTHSTKSNFIKIDLVRLNGHVDFTVQNSRDGIRTTEQPGGIGLNNVKRRLELLYPGKHDLKIQSNETSYLVHLKLKIESNEPID
jgi:sensor histidine kinase YesM